MRQYSTYSPIRFGLNASYCEIDHNGCVTDGAGAHGNNEACTIRVNSAGLLTATHVDTEAGYDYVTIGGATDTKASLARGTSPVPPDRPSAGRPTTW